MNEKREQNKSRAYETASTVSALVASAYTKGPWKLNDCMCAVQAKGPSGFWDVVAKCYDGNCYTKENLANARLIAAAPELLEALEELQKQADSMNNRQHAGIKIVSDDWSDLFRYCNLARAIINRAKGE